MEKRNTLLLTVIAVATLLVAVVGATFAYFAGNGDLNSVNANITTEAGATFTAVETEALSLYLPTSAMQQAGADAANNTVAADSSNTEMHQNNKDGVLTVKLETGDQTKDLSKAISCTYDIDFKWTGDDAWTQLTNQALTKEFTLTVTGVSTGDDEMNSRTETDFSALTKKSTTPSIVYSVVTNQSIETKRTTTHTWTFNAKIYNLNVNQSGNLANNNFIGSFSVSNVQC